MQQLVMSHHVNSRSIYLHNDGQSQTGAGTIHLYLKLVRYMEDDCDLSDLVLSLLTYLEVFARKKNVVFANKRTWHKSKLV